MTKNLEELKKKHRELGEEIERLEREPEGFLGLGKDEGGFALMDIECSRDHFLSITRIYPNKDYEGKRGYLNVYKTKEQAEAARYILICTLNEIKENLLKGCNLDEHYNISVPSGKRIAKELGLE